MRELQDLAPTIDLDDAWEILDGAVRRAKRRRRSRIAIGAVIVAIAGAVAVSRVGRDRDQIQTIDRPPTMTAPAAHGITATLQLPSFTITSGATMNGTVVIDNQSGAPITMSGCGPMVLVELHGQGIDQSDLSLACETTRPLPVGRSSYPVQVRATYNECEVAPSKIDCSFTSRPLPAGAYTLRPAWVMGCKCYQAAWGPPPVTIHVTKPTATAGEVIGNMRVEGGPAYNGPKPSSVQYLPGTVDVVRPGELTPLETLPVSTAGNYHISLPEGSYQLVGHTTITDTPIRSRVFAIEGGKTVSVDLVVVST